MTRTHATVVIPTTGDRGPLLPLCIASVLGQTMTDFEVFVIGDGLALEGQEIMADIVASDDRVRFFPFEKGSRRGETNRHIVLREHADSEIVTYLCDRDLYLPNHLEEMSRLLAEADLAHTLRFRMMEGDRIQAGTFPDLVDPAVRARRLPVIPLSFAGHRSDAYARLPHGWRTTPDEFGTDTYMWRQFVEQPWCRIAASVRPTVLTFKRGPHPGWPTTERRRILEHWQSRLSSPGLEDELTKRVMEAHVTQASGWGADAARVRTARAEFGRRLRARLSLTKRRLMRAVAAGVRR